MVELQDFVQWWNSHTIRKNRNANVLSGVPNELYELPGLHGMTLECLNINTVYMHLCKNFITIIIIGTVDCIKPIDSTIWVKAFLDETGASAIFYPDEFKEWADDNILEDFNLTQEQILSLICKELYLYLLSMDE